MRIAFDPIYKYDLPPGHRFPMAKYELLPEQLLYEGTASAADFFNPPAISERELMLTHAESYYQRLCRQELSAKEIRAIGFPLSPKLVLRGRHIAMGTLMCARFSREDGVALNIAGGTHHSYSDRGEGFCLFNDIAVAIHVLLETGEISRAMVIDLDVHQGNGTAKIFESDPRVFTLSVHGERNYPLRKEQSSLDIGLPDGTEDQAYLDSIRGLIPNLLDAFQPDQVFYLSGVDVLKADKLGRLNLSIEGCKERDRIVLTACHSRQLPVAVSMGGGYADRLATIIEAHANTYRVARALYS